MSALAWLPPLLAKALATALTVTAASLAAQALGPLWGAVIACLPVSAGPAYVFLAIERGPDFVAASALHSAAANAATGLFLLTYMRYGREGPVWRGLGLALAAWLAASLAIGALAWSVGAVLALNLLVYGAGFVLLARPAALPPAPAPPSRRGWRELAIRASAIGGFVALLVGASAGLGPEATGVAAVFPVSLCSLVLVLRPRLGGAATVRVAANALPPMLGFGLMLLALHLAVRPLGAVAALLLALAICLAWSGALLLRDSVARRH